MTPELLTQAKTFRDVLSQEGLRITSRFSFVGDIVILESLIDPFIGSRFLNLDKLMALIHAKTGRYPRMNWGVRRFWFRHVLVMEIWLHRTNPTPSETATEIVP